MSDPLAWIDDALEQLEHAGLRRSLRTRASAQSPALIELSGRRMVNFGSNDYLGFAAEDFLAAAVRDSLDTFGWGSGASPLLGGRSEEHVALEKETARFEQTEASLIFPTGFAANAGCLAALAGPDDAVFSDASNHASIIDGCRLSKAHVEVYRHSDMGELEQRLKLTATRRKLIVTDSLFSMDGDIAPLADLAELAERYEAMLMVDEAHATGVFGEHGRGLCEQSGVEEAVSLRIGTYSKALGSIGGFAAGPRKLIEWLQNRARPYFFSTAGPPAAAAASRAALRKVVDEPHRRRELLDTSAAMRERLRHHGWNVGESTSQIIPLIIGQPDETMELSRRLEQEGIYAPGVRPPSVAPGRSMIRISLSHAHSASDLDRLIECLGRPSA